MALSNKIIFSNRATDNATVDSNPIIGNIYSQLTSPEVIDNTIRLHGGDSDHRVGREITIDNVKFIVDKLMNALQNEHKKNPDLYNSLRY
jgi:hypothetical protein